ncbi:hypothetical protein GN956_G18306 [Arapaima gigas]
MLTVTIGQVVQATYLPEGLCNVLWPIVLARWIQCGLQVAKLFQRELFCCPSVLVSLLKENECVSETSTEHETCNWTCKSNCARGGGAV